MIWPVLVLTMPSAHGPIKTYVIQGTHSSLLTSGASSISLFRLCLLYSLKIAGFGINKLLPADTLSRQEWQASLLKLIRGSCKRTWTNREEELRYSYEGQVSAERMNVRFVPAPRAHKMVLLSHEPLRPVKSS